MGYPGQKYRQEHGNSSMPGQNQNQQGGYNAGPPPQANYGYNAGPPPPPQGNYGYNAGPPPQGNYNNGPPQGGYNSGPPQPPFPNSNNSFPSPMGMPQPDSSFPMPGGNMPGGNMPGFNNSPFPQPDNNMNAPPPYSNNNFPRQNDYGPPQSNNFGPPQTNFNSGPPQPNFNNSYGAPPMNNSNNYYNDHRNQQHFQGPPQPGPQNNAMFHQAPPMQQVPPNQPLPPGAGQYMSTSNFQGRKKALLVGINYYGTKAELRGCINDVKNVKDFICRYYNFSTNDMVILTDDQKDSTRIPTRQNMLQAMRWLVQDAKPNDSLFFHFSGHGSQQKDTDGDEDDGYDETICPVDYTKAGMIVDDEMNAIMVRPLPQGCRLTAIMDCCHSGTALDLPYIYDHNGKLISYSPAKSAQSLVMDLGKKYMMGDIAGALMGLKNGVSLLKGNNKAEKISKETKSSLADVVMFSGCMDSQTSADAVIASQATGAMSYALIKALSTNPHGMSMLNLLHEVRNILRGKYTQVPQLSSGRPMDMNMPFNM